MKRKLPITGLAGEVYNETTIRQRTKDSYFNATDLMKIYNKITGSKKRMSDFFDKQGTEEFSKVIEKHQNSKDGYSRLLQFSENQRDTECENPKLLVETEDGNIGIRKKAFEKRRGRNGGTWMHPYLFIDFAMWLSPEFKYRAIKWVYDNLIELRTESGDYFKKMSSELKAYCLRNFGKVPSREVYRKEALMIKKMVGLDEGDTWNAADKNELELRNKLLKYNIKLLKKDKDRKQRIRKLLNAKEVIQSTSF
jgi:hypothetical protein